MATRIKVKRILELLEKDLSANEIAKTYNISKHSIQAVRARASELGISSEKAKEQSDEELYQLFFPDRMSSQNIYLLPDYEYVHKELRKVGVTLKLSGRLFEVLQGLWKIHRDKELREPHHPQARRQNRGGLVRSDDELLRQEEAQEHHGLSLRRGPRLQPSCLCRADPQDGSDELDELQHQHVGVLWRRLQDHRMRQSEDRRHHASQGRRDRTQQRV